MRLRGMSVTLSVLLVSACGGAGTSSPTTPTTTTTTSTSTSTRTIGLLVNTGRAFDGYTLFAPKQNRMTYLINNDGRIMHQWTASRYAPGQSVYLLENGHLLHTCMISTGSIGTGGGVTLNPPSLAISPTSGFFPMGQLVTVTSSSTNGRIRSGPSAQFKPIVSGAACASEFQNASTVWPVSVRPERSVIVPETINGSRVPRRSKTCWIAKIAALALSVSKMVSTSSRSAPPSMSVSI